MSLLQSLKITWFSPERISKVSFGKITEHKTINARTLKPELGGLFDPRIFGPYLNYECYCGKYKGKENKGLKCPNCEVLVNEKVIQRWRMGHVELASPVTNILLFKTIANSLGKILEISAKDLEKIIYCQVFVVLNNGLTNSLKKKDILERKIDPSLLKKIYQEICQSKNLKSEIIAEAKELEESCQEKDIDFLENHLEFLEKHWKIKIRTGSEAFQELLRDIDPKKELTKESKGKGSREKIKLLRAFLQTGIKPEWMVFSKLPVIPCGLRPATKLKEENTIVTTQLNNLYRKPIIISERIANYLQHNKELKVFPAEIIYNEKSRLQKAVDQLLQGASWQGNEVKSLLQSLSGKDGILRRYSLGKRVDYSARSVIIANPNLLLDQIGLPVKMALKLYHYFIIQKMLKEKITFTVEETEQLILKEDPVIFSYLKQVVQDHPVLANRAPSLHRLSIQGFYPQLTLGKSIELHPLVTTALNADFDGDQIAIHLPLTKEAKEEIKEYVLAPQQIFNPQNGHLIDIPSQDMILGIYWLTQEKKREKIIFYDNLSAIHKSHNLGKLETQELIAIPANLAGRHFASEKNRLIFTTLGKIIFNQILPPSFSFYLNDLKEYNEKENFFQYQKELLIEADQITDKWKKYSPLSGWKKKEIITFLNKLIHITPQTEMVKFLDQLKKLGFDHATYSGISISPFEIEEIKDKKKLLNQTESEISQIEDYYNQGFYSKEEKKQKKIASWEICKEKLQEKLTANLENRNKESSFYHIWNSGARASSENLTQLFAMRGLTTNYLGEVIETPIISSLWEGLSPFEFFNSCLGAIKGVISTALKTGVAGYLTRRLVESSQGITISSPDCQTESGIICEEKTHSLLAKKIYGRYLTQDISNQNGEIILTRNTILLEKEMKIIQENQIRAVQVRSPLNCELIGSLCQKCYGLDLSKQGETVNLGVAVGIIAAQSLGEPGTQLTMNVFHTGGITGQEEITQGLPKVEQIFDNIKPKKEQKAVLAKEDGIIISIEEKSIRQRTNDGQEISYAREKEKPVRVQIGEKVKRGTQITGGTIDLEEYLEITGREATQIYIKEEIKKVYDNQGIDINEKHIEIFARQMLSRVEVIASDESDYLVKDIINYRKLKKINQSLLENKKKPIGFKNIISNLKDLASNPPSFLAGISFQNTLKSLVNYSLFQPVDYLVGIKENMMAGQLIPVGTGFKEREKHFRESRRKRERK